MVARSAKVKPPKKGAKVKAVPEQEAPRDGLATVKEAAQFLRCTTVTIYNLINAGDLKSTRIGRMRRIAWKDIRTLSGTN